MLSKITEYWFNVKMFLWVAFMVLYAIFTSPLILWRKIRHEPQETLEDDYYD